MLILCQSSSSHSYNIVAASISGNGLKFLWHFKASPHLNLLFWTARHVVVVLSLLLSINKKSASCENVNKPRLHWCDRCMWAHTVHADGALKAVSLVRPSLSFLSVNQYLLTKRAPSPTTSTSPAEGKGKSMVPVSTDWQGRQRHVNHSSQAMADFPGHRSEKNLYKTHYSMTCHHIRRTGRGGEWEARINLRFTRKVSSVFLHSHAPFLFPSGTSLFLYLWQAAGGKIAGYMRPEPRRMLAFCVCLARNTISSSLISLLTFPRYRAHTSPVKPESLVNKPGVCTQR